MEQDREFWRLAQDDPLLESFTGRVCWREHRAAKGKRLRLMLRRRILKPDSVGRNHWRAVTTPQTVSAAETALVVGDVWEKHWARGATERLDAMAPCMNQVIEAARSNGIQIIHAPAGTLAHYENTPARRRILEAPSVQPPSPPMTVEELNSYPNSFPPMPIDASGGGSDTSEKPSDTGEFPWDVWQRQDAGTNRPHSAIKIDQKKDGLSDSGQEIYSFMQQRGIHNIVLMGVHLNFCMLNRPFGIKQMVKWGVNVAFVRDLTDAQYNPAMPPYVSHEEGTRLVVEYVEKFWCHSIASDDLTD